MNSFPYKETLLLFFFTFLTNEVGCAKAEQHGNAAAQRSILVTISTVARKTRTTLHHTAAFFLFIKSDASVQQATVLGKGTQSHRKNDCYCQC